MPKPDSGDSPLIDTLDWDSIYRQQGPFPGPPPWNIGHTQPELVTLINTETLTGPILDAGCGVGELALLLASLGHTVVGLDLSSAAIESARKEAQQRSITHAHFHQADITDITTWPSGYQNHFMTIMDSALLHSLPAERRDHYLRSIYQASLPEARYYALVFAQGAFPDQVPSELRPYEFSQEELVDIVSSYWVVDNVQSSWIFAHDVARMMERSGQKNPASDSSDEDSAEKFDSFIQLPAFLLQAHRKTQL